MISKSFYTKKNVVHQYLDGKVPHYPTKNPSVTLEWYEYILHAGETLYSVAQRLFGKDLGYMWTLLADNNALRHPDDWRAGDIIRLPRIIIRDSDTIRPTFNE